MGEPKRQLLTVNVLRPGIDASIVEVLFVAADDDWVRLSPTFWLVWTDAGLLHWSNKIREVLGDVPFLVVILDQNFTGWLPEAAWKWMQKYQPTVTYRGPN
jgi:hypothetical protein